MPDRRRTSAVGGRPVPRAASAGHRARGARRLGAVPRARPRARGPRAVRVGRGRPPRGARARRRRDAPAPRPASSGAPRPQRRAGADLMSTRVLIADDETIIRLDLRALLDSAGLEVCAEARDGIEAVELAEASAPDIAILDVKMPRLDGLEAARRILEGRSLPIVMLTAYGDAEIVARAAEAGVFAYLVKPFREQDVVPAIQTAQARHAELAELRLEAHTLREALEARKAIERAKGILMAKEGLTESEAFERLRRASQRSGRPMKLIADAVAATLS